METAPIAHTPIFTLPLRLRAKGSPSRAAAGSCWTGIDFSLSGGEALVVTGRNGVGKSTLLRALAGLLPHRRRERSTWTAREEGELAQAAHYLAHADGMKAALTVEENLEFWASFSRPRVG